MTLFGSTQKAQYARDRFVSPVQALCPDEVASYRANLESLESEIRECNASNEVDGKYRFRLHTPIRWAHELAAFPVVLDAIKALIGPDVLIYMTTFSIKEAQMDAITGCHQDATYFGLRPYEYVSAWISLLPAALESGCMRFVPGSHQV